MKNKMKTFFCLCSYFFMLPSAFGAETLAYQATSGGMHLMDAALSFEQTPDAYRMQIDTETMGLFSLLFDNKTTLKSSGKIDKNQFIVSDSYIKSITGDKIKTKLVPISDRGTLDYQTIVLDMMNLPAPSSKKYLAFDGKRTLAVTFTYMGEQVSDMPDYPGMLDVYRVSIEVLSGKKKGWFFEQFQNDKAPLTVYFDRRLGPNRVVKTEFRTPLLGQIDIQLKDK